METEKCRQLARVVFRNGNRRGELEFLNGFRGKVPWSRRGKSAGKGSGPFLSRQSWREPRTYFYSTILQGERVPAPRSRCQFSRKGSQVHVYHRRSACRLCKTTLHLFYSFFTSPTKNALLGLRPNHFSNGPRMA